MWRISWLLLVLVALAISAFSALPPQTVEDPLLQQTATARASRTPRVTPTRTRRATPTRRATATRRPTRTPTATPDPRIWAGLTDYQDQGSPLPPSARTFGGGLYMPKSAIQTSGDGFDFVVFEDDLVLGVGAYYPNRYNGNTPVLLPDETGVDRVEFTLSGPNGTVYRTTENNKPFCLFGDSNGRCTRYDFENNDCEWPASNEIDASPITEGFYDISVVITGTVSIPDPNGGSESVLATDNWFGSFEIRFPSDSDCAGPRQIFFEQYEIAGCCNSAGQRNDSVLSAEVAVTTEGYLGAEVFLRGDACSDVSFRLFVDDDFVARSEFVGPFGDGWDGSDYMTSFIDLGDYDPGTYTIRISPEGRVGGCNEGGLGNWEGKVNVYYSQ